jgi:putative ABC transport system permease protein
MIRQLIALGRGLAHRAGSAAMLLIVAIVAAAAAAAGPVYYQAAQRSIMIDTIARAPVIGQSYQATMSGGIQGTLASLQSYVKPAFRHDLGPDGQRLFQAPVDSILGSANDSATSQTFPVVWQTAACAHLVITGRCPSAAGQTIISKSDSVLMHWRIGSQLRGTGWPTLTVTGIYQAPELAAPYWILQANTYFPREEATAAAAVPGLDAVFVSSATIASAPYTLQGTSTIQDMLAPGRLTVGDVGPLQNDMNAFVNNGIFTAQNITVQSTLPTTLAGTMSGWRSVAVPVVLTTATMLLLSLLLLFLIVTDAVEARGPEIALAKLRGHGRIGILVFGLSEPAVVLITSLPVGVLVGWLAAGKLARSLLLPGTQVGLPWTAWLAAAAATAGGFTALILAAQRALRRGVVEQFRRPSRLASGRGWVVDSILLTLSVAGLFEVLSTNQIGSASHGTLELLVPGLLGLAVAVVASRLLPLGCRALYGFTSRHGGLAAYLAIRHIARREGGVRTTIVLATAFSLAAFAFAAWTVGQHNYQLVADTQVGAPEVLTVTVPAGRNLSAIVDKSDPSGHLATAVDTYIGLSGGTAGQYTLAVEPARFARIADWPRQVAGRSVASLIAQLQPPAASPIVVTGDALRATVDVKSLSLAGEQLYVSLTAGSTPDTLGTLPRHGSVTLTTSLVGCPCVLQNLAMTQPGGAAAYGQSTGVLSGSLTITALQVQKNGHWVSAAPASALGTAADWRNGTSAQAGSGDAGVSAGPGGLTWAVNGVPTANDPTLAAANIPAPMPAIVAASVNPQRQPLLTGNGLDGSPLRMRVLADLPSIPGAPINGVVIDQRYGQLEAQQNLFLAGQQVWLARGADAVIRPKLIAAGVKITGQTSTAAVTAQLERQGPALASALFLGDAAAAALLAAGAAILGLYASARRRRYEYAAMEASGVRRRSLRTALLLELAVVLGFGTLVGAATGLIGAHFVLRSVPEFTTLPTEPPLSYVPAAAPVAILLCAAACLLVLAALMSSYTLIRGVRADLLRETPA